MRKWMKSRYYPVDLDAKLIYDEPQCTEFACSYPDGKHHTGRIGIKGMRLTAKTDAYADFTVIPRGCVPKTCAACGHVYGVPSDLDGLPATEYVCRRSCKDEIERREGITTQ